MHYFKKNVPMGIAISTSYSVAVLKECVYFKIITSIHLFQFKSDVTLKYIVH